LPPYLLDYARPNTAAASAAAHGSCRKCHKHITNKLHATLSVTVTVTEALVLLPY